MNPLIIINATSPKALNGLDITGQRQFDKYIKQYTVIVESLKIKDIQHQSIVIQAKADLLLSVTYENVSQKRIKVVFRGDINQLQQKPGLTKIPLKLPTAFTQLQFFFNAVGIDYSKMRELEISGTVMNIMLSDQFYQPSILYNEQQYMYSTTPKNFSLIPMHQLLIDKQSVEILRTGKQKLQLHAEFNGNDDFQQFLVENGLDNVQFDQVKGAEIPAQLTEPVAKLERKEIVEVKKANSKPRAKQQEKKKQIKLYKDFVQNSQSEHSEDYDFEDLDLKFQQFEITYPTNMFQGEEGKDGNIMRELTPVKVKGQKIRQQKLIGVQMTIKGRTEQIDWEAFEVEPQAAIEEQKAAVEISEESLSIGDVLDQLSIENVATTTEDFQNYQQFKLSGRQVIGNYLIDKMTDKDKNDAKQQLINGNLLLEDHKKAMVFGLVYDLVQQGYFELDDSD